MAKRLVAHLLLSAIVCLPLVGCSGDGRTPIIVYSPHGKAQLEAFEERFEAAYPQFDVQPQDLPSQDIITRLRAEKANPQADVWWGASAVTFAQAADEDLLDPYQPAWGSTIADEAHDPQYRWVGVYETPEIIVYNSETVQEADAPKDWDDLLDPKWRGKILLRDPISSDTMRTIFGAIILKEWPKTNSPQAGYDWLTRFAENTKDYSPSWDAVLTALHRQEASLSVWNMPDVRRVVDERGFKLGISYPKSGSPVVIDGIALVKGGPHAEGAKLFYEFVNSPESLVFSAQKFYRIPTRTDIDRKSLPDWIGSLNITRMPMDWARFRENGKDWMSHWSNEIKTAGVRR